jgi:glycerophosphoryl diester phosphodiesterase
VLTPRQPAVNCEVKLMKRLTRVLTLLVVALTAATLAAAPVGADGADNSGHGRDRADQVLVIGHRGAAGYRPEHTLASYELAARMGADYIEPDLVSTKDHVLIARHENDITGTTDVADHPEFADRKTTKTIDGQPITGWFSEDFTLAEIRTLHAKERLPDLRQHNTIYDGQLPIPTLDEILDLRARLSRELGRAIGVYPETKHPTYFRSIGLDLETPLVTALKKARLANRNDPVFIQSFELKNLELLRSTYHVRTKLIFLTSTTGNPFGDTRSYADLTTPTGLRTVAKTAEGIGPDKLQIIPRDPAGNLVSPTGLVQAAHAAGLLVHPYTFRAENEFLPTNYRTGTDPADYGRILDELAAYLNTGIDGFFTDQADIGVLARDRQHRPDRH